MSRGGPGRWVALGVALVAGMGLSWSLWSAPDRTTRQGDHAAWYDADDRGSVVRLSGLDLDGAQVKVESWAGSPVVINIWGSWCAPCRQEAPILAATEADYRTRGVRFLGINVKDDRAAARAFERKNAIDYPSIDDSDGRAVVQLAEFVPPSAVPATVVLDRTGRVAYRSVGPVTTPGLRAALDRVLGEGA